MSSQNTIQKLEKIFFLLTLFVLSAMGWGIFPTFADTPDSIHTAIREGRFTEAQKMIGHYIAEADTVESGTAAKDIWNWQLQKDILNRIKIDFQGNEERILKFIKRYYPDVTPEQLQKWKDEKSLEVMKIDGKECYFHSAAPNLFRINKEARNRKLEIDGAGEQAFDKFLQQHLTEVHNGVQSSGRAENQNPADMRVVYTLTVLPDTVPEGEVIRCWLPYPQQNHRRQTGITFLESNLENPVIAPPETEHSSIYSEKIAVKGQPTVFRASFQYRAAGEWFDLNKREIKPYDKESELYKKYTAERSEHIVFTEEIKNLSAKIVGTEKEPLAAFQKIYGWITATYPWASAREYSTIQNIPSYVIENAHGDCGMLSLLLITLCRHNGIPAKWQSGFMMHPGSAGLHDWSEVYFEGVGWIPVDTSFGLRQLFDKVRQPELASFFMCGMDSYRLIVNEDYSSRFYPAKIYPRSETVDFQRGEVEWRGGNLYFDKWNWNIKVEYLNESPKK